MSNIRDILYRCNLILIGISSHTLAGPMHQPEGWKMQRGLHVHQAINLFPFVTLDWI